MIDRNNNIVPKISHSLVSTLSRFHPLRLLPTTSPSNPFPPLSPPFLSLALPSLSSHLPLLLPLLPLSL